MTRKSFVLFIVPSLAAFFPVLSAAEKPAKSADVASVVGELRRLTKANMDAFKKGDFPKLIDFVHPSLIQLAGGRDQAIARVQEKFDQYKSEGTIVEKAEVSDPTQILHSQSEKCIYAMVPTKVTLRTADERIVQSSHLLGLRDDETGRWSFVELGVTGETIIRLLLPGLPSQLKFPEKQEPVREPIADKPQTPVTRSAKP